MRRLEIQANLYAQARVTCVDCDLVLLMSSSNEIGSTGRWLCGDCEYGRVLNDVITKWHAERGLSVTPPRRHRCRRCEEDSMVIGSQLLCPECLDSYHYVVTSGGCDGCGARREDDNIELFTRLDHEGLYCTHCVGNQARECCTVRLNIAIMEVVRANVVSDVAVLLGETDEEREALAAEGSESDTDEAL